MNTVECQALSHVIIVAVEQHLNYPEVLNELNTRIDRHQKQYPSGTLPTELRSWDAFKRHRLRYMDETAKPKSRCLKC